jgi:DNA uptake protein ComE-like DNA-binding protein
MTNDATRAQQQAQKQVEFATEWAIRSARAWNDLVFTTTDMAFDVALKNWDYSRSLRASAEQAIEDAVRTQQRLAKEMMQVWQGYATSVQNYVTTQVSAAAEATKKQAEA